MDGQIIYQVRVDSSNVASDLTAAGSKISSGTSVLIALGQTAAQKIGSALSGFFSAQTTAMSSMLSSLSGGFSNLSGSAQNASGSLSAAAGQFQSLISLDTDKLLSFLTKFTSAANSVNTAAVGAAAGVGALTGAVASSSATTKLSGALSSISSGVSVSGGTTLPKYRSGSDYIEKDKYALLHKGEAVLTAAENQTLQAMGGVQGAAMLASRDTASYVIGQEQPAQSQQPSPQNVNVTVELDGYQMAKVMASATNELNRQLNTRIVK